MIGAGKELMRLPFPNAAPGEFCQSRERLGFGGSRCGGKREPFLPGCRLAVLTAARPVPSPSSGRCRSWGVSDWLSPNRTHCR